MTTRDRTLITIVCVVAAIVASWLMVVQPKRDTASRLGNQINSIQTQLTNAREQVAQSEAAKSSFSTSYANLVRLGEAVPVDDNVPSLIYQLQGAAGDAKVDFRSLQLTPATEDGSDSGSSGPSSIASAQASMASLPPGTTVGPAGFPTEQFTFAFRGNFFHLADFFHRLQQFVLASDRQASVSGRLITLNAINLAPAPAGFPHITASISATTYLVPPGQGLLNGATPSGPSASATQTVSTQPSSTPAPTAVITHP